MTHQTPPTRQLSRSGLFISAHTRAYTVDVDGPVGVQIVVTVGDTSFVAGDPADLDALADAAHDAAAALRTHLAERGTDR